MQRAAATGEAVSKSECEIVKTSGRTLFPDGGKLDLLGSVRPLFNEAGVTRASIGVFLEIRARKRRESNLAFLAQLQQTLTALPSSQEIMRVTSERLMQHLGIRSAHRQARGPAGADGLAGRAAAGAR